LIIFHLKPSNDVVLKFRGNIMQHFNGWLFWETGLLRYQPMNHTILWMVHNCHLLPCSWWFSNAYTCSAIYLASLCLAIESRTVHSWL
jgi:hypothetical protein